MNVRRLRGRVWHFDFGPPRAGERFGGGATACRRLFTRFAAVTFAALRIYNPLPSTAPSRREGFPSIITSRSATPIVSFSTNFFRSQTATNNSYHVTFLSPSSVSVARFRWNRLVASSSSLYRCRSARGVFFEFDQKLLSSERRRHCSSGLTDTVDLRTTWKPNTKVSGDLYTTFVIIGPSSLRRRAKVAKGRVDRKPFRHLTPYPATYPFAKPIFAISLLATDLLRSWKNSSVQSLDRNFYWCLSVDGSNNSITSWFLPLKSNF